MNTTAKSSEAACEFGPAPLERFPWGARIDGDDRESTLCPGNPAYAMCPKIRSRAEVDALITKGNKELPMDICTESRSDRVGALDLLPFNMVPLDRHVVLDETLCRTIRNSYIDRNPAEDGYMERAVNEARKIGTFQPRTGGGPVGSACLAGIPGPGKTESLKRLLSWGYPQVVYLKKYKGKDLGVQMLLWLYVSCPMKASVRGLIEWIATALDCIFGTDTLARVLRAPNDSARQRIIAEELALHVTGVLVIDEIQNMGVGQPDARRIFANFIQELVNTTRTRVMLVGTDEMFDQVESAALRARMCGEAGQLTWGPLNYQTEWPTYCQALFDWRVTKSDRIDRDALSEELYRCSGGLPRIASNLWTKAQSLVIDHAKYPNEELTPKVLAHTMTHYFPDIHRWVLANQGQWSFRYNTGPSADAPKTPDPTNTTLAAGAPDQANTVAVPPPPPRETPPPDGSSLSGFALPAAIA